MSNTEAVYCLHAICVGGCQRKILGPCRKASDPEFSSEIVEEFHRTVRESAGWSLVEGDETGDFWQCNTDCKPPWSFDPNEFTISPETRKRLKSIKPINPDFFGTVRVESL